MTIWDTTANTFYESDEALCMALAESIREAWRSDGAAMAQ